MTANNHFLEFVYSSDLIGHSALRGNKSKMSTCPRARCPGGHSAPGGGGHPALDPTPEAVKAENQACYYDRTSA